jgi:hypothetical protein
MATFIVHESRLISTCLDVGVSDRSTSRFKGVVIDAGRWSMESGAMQLATLGRRRPARLGRENAWTRALP